MKGYIIDSNLKGIFPIELDKDMDYKDIYKYLHTDVKRVSAFDVIRVRGTNDLIYVDDEGLLTRENYMYVFDHLDKQHLFGNGLILGTDTEGESMTPEMSLNWYRDKITFADNLVLCEDYLVPPVFVPMK
jgi:hypothetical protein